MRVIRGFGVSQLLHERNYRTRSSDKTAAEQQSVVYTRR